jgi:hypothetical protein
MSVFSVRHLILQVHTCLINFDTIGDENVRKRILEGSDCGGWKKKEGCLPGTRRRYIEELLRWTTDLEAARSFWLTGPAGSGKSAITHEIASRLHEANRIYGCFFFKREDPTISSSVIQLLAYGLSYHIPSLRTSIARCMGDLRVVPSIMDQFQMLLVEPLRSFSITNPHMPVILILDALDECPYEILVELLMVIRKGTPLLPKNIKVLLTSRPLHDIAVDVGFLTPKHMQIQISHAIDDRDLELYFNHHLTEIRRRQTIHEPDWSDTTLASYASALAIKARGLFQWAAIACALLRKQSNPYATIQHILTLPSGENTQVNLDTLYTESLMFALPNVVEDSVLHHVYVEIMGMIIMTKEPLDTETIAGLAHLEFQTVENVLTDLGCVISVETEHERNVAHIVHPSFFEFVTDENRCKNPTFLINKSKASTNLALACLHVMQKELKFNIGQLTTSHIFNTNYPDLDLQVKTLISPQLSYSCCFWAHHVKETNLNAQHVCQEIRKFMSSSFLYWLEVLSLIKKMHLASQTLVVLVEWGRVSFFFC